VLSALARLRAGLSALALLALLAPPAVAADAAAGGGDVLDALPGGPDVRVEAAVVVPDLRALEAAYERRLAPLRKLKGGAELVAAVDSRDPKAAFDPWAEWERLLALAGPQGSPVPAAVVVFSRGQDFGIQGLLKVAPGFSDRLAATVSGAKPPPWRARTVADGFEFAGGGVTVFGRVDPAGWLRLAPEKEMLLEPAPGGPGLDAALATRVREAEAALFLQGGGALARMLAAELTGDSPEVAQIITGVRSLSLTWKTDGDRSYATRLAVDLPMLSVFGPTVRKPDLANVLASRWDTQATGFLSLSLPEGAKQAVLPLLGSLLAGTPYAPPKALMAALGQLEGRIGVVGFGAPDDWAVGVQFVEAAAASSAVAAVHEWAGKLLAEHAPSAADAVALEEGPGGAKVLHIRPDPVLQGVRVAAVGPTLVIVRQRQRLAQMSAPPPPEGGARPTVVAGPLTPLVHQTLERPALLLAYWVFGTDIGLFDWLVWGVKGLEVVVAEAFPTDSEEAGLVRAFTHRLAPRMAMAGYTTLLSYDLAVALDVQGSLLTLDFVGSDL